MLESPPPGPRVVRAPWSRLAPPVAFLAVTALCMLINTTDFSLMWPLAAGKKPQAKGGTLFPNTRLLRFTESRDKLLTHARETLEHWWHIKQAQAGGAAQPCPFSMAGRSEPPDQELEEMFGSLKQSIDIMEAMGFANLTTCGGRYPRFVAEDSPDLGSPTDKIQGLLASVDNSAANTEELIMSKFCYSPTFRPPTPENFNTEQQAGQRKLVSVAGFCSRLLQLHRDIIAGREPPLLTIFTWIPDPIEDAAKVSRRYLALNLDMFKPFVQPVLVTDRRMVMAIANSINWPALPIAQLSPDNVPVFKASALDVTARFNSTFYGYARGVSIFDASLLETLIAVKEKFLRAETSTKVTSSRAEHPKTPDVFVYGSAMYKQDLSFRSNYSAVGSMAESRASSDWPEGESSLTYLIHTRQAFTDLPAVKIDDKDLVPFLAERALLLGNRVIDASSTILTVYNVHLQNTNEWNRILLPSTPRLENYNRVMASTYLESLRQRMTAQRPIVSIFNSEGQILFKQT
ncbi:hypothetical protein EGW08_020649 [Elysia chlorotica]|uniref:Uncharacterized protein n=1 Tax=Elysia chlorotica TaxID=188477 RepID=A0A433SQR1_ELYCH|nr:hypothetical protein EGW08_020649 [Elysia chlorotica]